MRVTDPLNWRSTLHRTSTSIYLPRWDDVRYWQSPLDEFDLLLLVEVGARWYLNRSAAV